MKLFAIWLALIVSHSAFVVARELPHTPGFQRLQEVMETRKVEQLERTEARIDAYERHKRAPDYAKRLRELTADPKTEGTPPLAVDPKEAK